MSQNSVLAALGIDVKDSSTASSSSGSSSISSTSSTVDFTRAQKDLVNVLQNFLKSNEGLFEILKYQGFDPVVILKVLVEKVKTDAGKTALGVLIAYYVTNSPNITPDKLKRLDPTAKAMMEKSIETLSVKTDMKSKPKLDELTLSRIVAVVPQLVCSYRMRFGGPMAGVSLLVGKHTLSHPLFCSSDAPYMFDRTHRGYFLAWLVWAKTYHDKVNSKTPNRKFNIDVNIAKLDSFVVTEAERKLYSTSFDKYLTDAGMLGDFYHVVEAETHKIPQSLLNVILGADTSGADTGATP